MTLAPAEKRLAVAIWTSPAFRGSREDAGKLAKHIMRADVVAESPDLFGAELAMAEPPRAETNPLQPELF